MIKIVQYALLLVLLMLTPLAAQAWTVSGPPLLAVTEEAPPYNYRDDSGAIAGLSTEMVHALLAEAGLTADFELYPWARSFSLARTRPNTLIFSIARSKQREKMFIWIGELQPHTGWFFRRKQTVPLPTSLEAIKASGTVCVVSKDIAEDELKQIGFEQGHSYVAAESYFDCMRLVQSGSVAFLVDSPLSLAWTLSLHPPLPADFEPVMAVPHSGTEPLYLAASLGSDPVQIERLQQAWRRLQQSGKFDQIRQKCLKKLGMTP